MSDTRPKFWKLFGCYAAIYFFFVFITSTGVAIMVGVAIGVGASDENPTFLAMITHVPYSALLIGSTILFALCLALLTRHFVLPTLKNPKTWSTLKYIILSVCDGFWVLMVEDLYSLLPADGKTKQMFNDARWTVIGIVYVCLFAELVRDGFVIESLVRTVVARLSKEPSQAQDCDAASEMTTIGQANGDEMGEEVVSEADTSPSVGKLV